MLKSRPKAPKAWLEGYHSGNDYIRSKIEIEYCAGDTMKAIGVLMEQLSDYSGLQNAEILSLCKCYLDEHIIEEDVE